MRLHKFAHRLWAITLTCALIGAVAAGAYTLHRTTTQKAEAAAIVAAEREEVKKASKESFERAFGRLKAKLKKRGIPFDPELLRGPDVAKNVRPYLNRIPEMNEDKHLPKKIGGIYFAHTIYINSDTVAEGEDVFILARNVVYEGCGSTIAMKGAALFMHILETGYSRVHVSELQPDSQPGVSYRRASYNPNSNSNLVLPTGTSLAFVKGGYAYLMFCSTYTTSDGASISGSGGEGTWTGISSPRYGQAYTGDDGTCAGSVGETYGQPGKPGNYLEADEALPGGTTSGIAGTGQEGNTPPVINCTISCGDFNSYSYVSTGGKGQKGGTGAAGGWGGKGKQGGNGGNGAACCGVVPGVTGVGKGGRGGQGGPGGKGGDGQRGGMGGRPGRGGYILVYYPSNANQPAAVSTGGVSGDGGDGGVKGVGGDGGEPGNPGSSVTSGNCEGQGVDGVGLAGPRGDDGDHAGANGPENTEEAREHLDIDLISYPCASCDVGEMLACGQIQGAQWMPYPDCFCDEDPPTPVILDVLGNGFNLTNQASGVHFDLNSNGAVEKLSWTAFESDDAFLAWDRNLNGKIDNGRELFSNFTEQPTSSNRNGFAALAMRDLPEYGGNGDGKIDAQDSIFESLTLWRDANHNGYTDDGELRSLSDAGVTVIELDYKESGRQDRWGNRFKYRAKVWDVRDTKIGRWAWDVFLLDK